MIDRMIEGEVVESHWLQVPTEEHFGLQFKADFIKDKEGKKWIRLSAIADHGEIIADRYETIAFHEFTR